MRSATARGCETYTAWLPFASAIVAPARFAIARCASGGIIRSSSHSSFTRSVIEGGGSKRKLRNSAKNTSPRGREKPGFFDCFRSSVVLLSKQETSAWFCWIAGQAGRQECGRRLGFGQLELWQLPGPTVLCIDFIGLLLRQTVARPVHQAYAGTAAKGTEYRQTDAHNRNQRK
jgi:hypothetical protein